MIAAIFVLLIVLATCQGSSNAPDYVSVRALDEFGHSVQLKHAREAASRHGRLVVAARAVDGDTIVVSLGDTPMMQVVTLPASDGSSPPTVALVAVGIKGDASWLLSQVRAHAKNVWGRYGHHLDGEAVAHVASRALGDFLGDNLKKELRSSVKRDSVQWARPLGVQVMVVQSGQCDNPILFIEPSGRVLLTSAPEVISGPNLGTRVEAMGRDSQLIHGRVSRERLGAMESEELERTLVDMIVDEINLQQGHAKILVEKLSCEGRLSRTVVEVKDGSWAVVD